MFANKKRIKLLLVNYTPITVPTIIRMVFSSPLHHLFTETAMGRHVNAQSDADSEYVKAIYE